MIRAAALLAVLALTGSPVATAVCDAWCLAGARPGGMEHDACHQSPRGAETSVQAFPDSCDNEVAWTAFVPKARHRALENVPCTPLVSGVSAPLVGGFHREGATALLRRPPGFPPGLSITPLRI